MSESSVDSESISKQNGRDQDDNDKSTPKIRRSLRALLCCFKSRKPHAVTNHGEIVDYNNDAHEYDYIVEKLVVKRVPLDFLALPELEDRYQTPSTISPSTSLSTDSDDISSITTSAKTMIDRAYDFAASKVLRFDEDENQATIRKSLRHKDELWQQETTNGFDAPYSDSRSAGPSTYYETRQSFAENISGMTPSARSGCASTCSANIQNNMPVQRGPPVGYGIAVVRRQPIRTNEVQMNVNDNPGQSQDARPPENTQDTSQSRPMLGWNRKYVVQPFQVKRRSFDLARSRPDTFGDGVEGKSLEYIGESVEDRSVKSDPEHAEERDSRSKATLRWRITIRHRSPPSDADANSEGRVAPEA